jgi:hypothetical protein
LAFSSKVKKLAVAILSKDIVDAKVGSANKENGTA